MNKMIKTQSTSKTECPDGFIMSQGFIKDHMKKEDETIHQQIPIPLKNYYT